MSSGTSVDAKEAKATIRPSALIVPPWAPDDETLTRVVVLVWRLWTKTSLSPLESPATKFVDPETNATYRPSPLMTASPEPRFPC